MLSVANTNYPVHPEQPQYDSHRVQAFLVNNTEHQTADIDDPTGSPVATFSCVCQLSSRRAFQKSGEAFKQYANNVQHPSDISNVSETILRSLAAECYTAGPLPLPLLSSPSPAAIHTILSLVPSLAWLPNLIRILVSKSVTFTTAGHQRAAKKAVVDHPFLALLPTLYGVTGVRKNDVQVGFVNTFSGAGRIATLLNYPLRFIDTGVTTCIPASRSSSSPAMDVEDSEAYRFVTIDLDCQQVLQLRVAARERVSDPVGHFLQGCGEALDEGAVVVETHMEEAAFAYHADQRERGNTLIARIRSLITERKISTAWYRLPRTMIQESSYTVAGSSGRSWSASEPGVFLCGQVYADGEDVADLSSALVAAGVQLQHPDISIISALADVAGDPRTRFDVPDVNIRTRISAVIEFAFRHANIFEALSAKIRDMICMEKFISVGYSYIVPLLAFRIFEALQPLDDLISKKIKPVWKLLVDCSINTRNAYIVHLKAERKGNDIPEPFWLRFEAVRRSPPNQLENILDVEDVARVVREVQLRFCDESSSALEPHFANRQVKVFQSSGPNLIQPVFAINDIKMNAYISGYYILSFEEGKVMVTEAGVIGKYKIFTRFSPNVAIAGHGIHLNPLPDTIHVIPNAFITDCVTGKAGLKVCKWVLQAMVSEEFTVSVRSGCHFARLFAKRDGRHLIDGSVPADPFEDCLMMEGMDDNMFLILTDSICVVVRNMGVYFHPERVVDPRNQTFVRKWGVLKLPLGYPSTIITE